MRLPTAAQWKRPTTADRSSVAGHSSKVHTYPKKSFSLRATTGTCQNPESRPTPTHSVMKAESEDDVLSIHDGNSKPGSHDGSKAYDAGKNFWLNLLDNNTESESFVEITNSEETNGHVKNSALHSLYSARRTSLLGKEIEKTWSSGSPLSLSSAFEDHDTSPSVTPTESQPQQQRSRKSILQHWEQKIQASSGTKTAPTPIRSIIDGHNKFGANNDNNSGGVRSPPSSTHASVVIDTKESRRSFGDVTNRDSNHTSTYASTSKVTSFVENIRTVHLKPSQNKSSSTQRSVGNHEKTEMLAHAAKDIYHIAVFKNNKADASSSSRRLEVLQPNKSDQNKFHSAYENWRQAGLMKAKRWKPPTKERKDELKSDMSPNNEASVVRQQTTRPSQALWKTETGPTTGCVAATNPPGKSHDEVNASTSNETNRPCPFEAEKDSLQEPVHRLSTMRCKVTDLPGQDIEMTPSIEPDCQTGFQHLLGLWRDQGKDNSPKPSEEKVNDQPAISDEVSDADDDSDDFRKYTSESPVRMSKIHEVSAISAVSSELDMVTNTSHDNQVTIRSEGFVDSDEDVNEEKCNDKSNEPNSKAGRTFPALVILQKEDGSYQMIIGESSAKDSHNVVISNPETVLEEEESTAECKCECFPSVFSGNDDLILFFLPQMGMACSCGHQDGNNALIKPEDPTAIENILRPWQVEFLKRFGINRGEDLVKARHRSGDVLARALRQWRKKKGLAPFKTSSCGMALHIWAKTCKVYVRSIRQQLKAGNTLFERPPGTMLSELTDFLGGLPAAPAKRKTKQVPLLTLNPSSANISNIEPGSQVEV